MLNVGEDPVELDEPVEGADPALCADVPSEEVGAGRTIERTPVEGLEVPDAAADEAGALVADAPGTTGCDAPMTGEAFNDVEDALAEADDTFEAASWSAGEILLSAIEEVVCSASGLGSERATSAMAITARNANKPKRSFLFFIR